MALNKMEPQIVDYYLQPQNKEEALKEENANLKKEKENLHNKVKWVEKRLAKSEAENKKLNTIFQAKCATKDYKLTNGIVIQATQSEIDICENYEKKLDAQFEEDCENVAEIVKLREENKELKEETQVKNAFLSKNVVGNWYHHDNLEEAFGITDEQIDNFKNYVNDCALAGAFIEEMEEIAENFKEEEASCDDEDDNPTPRCDYCNRTYDEVMVQDDHPDAWNGETGCCFRCVERWDWMLLQLYGQ